MKYLLKPIVMGFLLASAVPSVTLASNNYALALDMARLKTIDNQIEKLNILGDRINLYILQTGDTAVTQAKLQAEYNLPNKMFTNNIGNAMTIVMAPNGYAIQNAIDTTTPNRLKIAFKKSNKHNVLTEVTSGINTSSAFNDKVAKFTVLLNNLPVGSYISGTTAPANTAVTWYKPDGDGNIKEYVHNGASWQFDKFRDDASIMTAISTVNSNVSNTVNTLSSDISDLGTDLGNDISGVANNVNTIKTTTNNTYSKVRDVEDYQSTTLKNQIKGVQNTVNTVKTNVATVNTNIGSVNTTLGNINTNIDNKHTALINKMNNINTNIDGVSTDLGNLDVQISEEQMNTIAIKVDEVSEVNRLLNNSTTGTILFNNIKYLEDHSMLLPNAVYEGRTDNSLDYYFITDSRGYAWIKNKNKVIMDYIREGTTDITDFKKYEINREAISRYNYKYLDYYVWFPVGKATDKAPRGTSLGYMSYNDHRDLCHTVGAVSSNYHYSGANNYYDSNHPWETLGEKNISKYVNGKWYYWHRGIVVKPNIVPTAKGTKYIAPDVMGGTFYGTVYMANEELKYLIDSGASPRPNCGNYTNYQWKQNHSNYCATPPNVKIVCALYTRVASNKTPKDFF